MIPGGPSLMPLQMLIQNLCKEHKKQDIQRRHEHEFVQFRVIKTIFYERAQPVKGIHIFKSPCNFVLIM